MSRLKVLWEVYADTHCRQMITQPQPKGPWGLVGVGCWGSPKNCDSSTDPCRPRRGAARHTCRQCDGLVVGPR